MDIQEPTNRKHIAITICVGATSFVGGFAIGYFLRKKKTEAELPSQLKLPLAYFSEAELPLDDTGHVTVNVVAKEVITGDKVDYTQFHDVGQSVEAEEEPEEIVDDPPELIRVFRKQDSDWDWDAETMSRTADAPYIIHHEEYMADEMGYRQDTVTYYAGDDIMADSLDVPIHNHTRLMGDLKFGHGSNDPSVVYIRNEKEKMEWEVLLHTGMFSVEVRGLTIDQEMEDEIRHSHSVLKFRDR